ncbi:MAG TPA: mechanosensitive ion channel family protein [Moraxellaceae bacterium]|nr:mechanosensitive ion channel family protein [Moraxellaceae bacterium]
MAQSAPSSSFALEKLLHPERLGDLVTGVVLILVGLLVASIAARVFERSMAPRLSTHQLSVWRRVIHHGLLILFVITALREMGFHLSVLLGAAGVLSVALGIASQTSASNLISGLFLIGEGSFAIGDTIRVGQTEGEVLSIDLLSIKLVTGDNLYVRIPNEQLIKSEVVNLTRFAIRKLNLALGIAYKEDVKRVRALLLQVAADNPLVLDEPAPQVILQNFGDSAINLQFSVWTRREHYGSMRDQLQETIKEHFDREGIEIPFPQMALSMGAEALSVRTLPPAPPA